MAEWTIYPIDAGTIQGLDMSMLTYGANFGIAIDIPCLAWVLRRGSEVIMVDAGPGTPDRVDGYHPPLEQGERQSVTAGLDEIGVDPAEVQFVVVTHLHWDHVGGIHELPNAEILVQRDELREAVDPVPTQRRTYETQLPGLRPAWMDVFDRVRPIRGDATLLDGVNLVKLPGHTAGSQGVVVTTEAGRYLIAGDTIPLYANWEGDQHRRWIPDGIHNDLYAYEDSFERIAAVADHVLPGHDAAVLEHPSYPA